MLVTRIELENIKNYEDGTFDFSPGVTAISGPNGAGKTTLLEAIAWAMFDHLPYKKEDFLRRGSKKGAVRVTFESSVDGREYTVYRDTGSGYYIYDPRTKMRLVEQKQQVSQWIRQHIGVEPGTDLKTLFTSTVGVPQGTFTVEFAEQPSKRKVSFDRVLRVDEYQKSSDELRSLLKLLESKDADLREEIARVEVEVSLLDGLIAEQSKLEKDIGTLASELRATERKRDEARAELDRLDEARKTLDQLGRDAAVAESKLAETERRRDTAISEVHRATAAAEAVKSSASGFAVYNEADEKLKSLEADAIRRDSIKAAYGESERELIRVESSLQAKGEILKQLESDRAEMERLTPLVDEQSNLESRLSDLQQRIGELSILRERATASEVELKSFRVEYAEIVRQIEETEKLRDTAQRAANLEDERRELETELREMKIELERIIDRRRELRRANETIRKLTGEIQTCEREIAAGADAEKIVAQLPEIEARDRALTEEIAGLKSDIQREKKIMAGISNGLCPLLNERCLNMKDGQGLDQYFQAQIGTENRRLAELETSRKDIQQQLKDAKAAMKTASVVEAHRVQLFRCRQELEIEEKNASRLQAEIEKSTVTDQTLSRANEKLARIEAELKESQQARIRYEGLSLLKDRLESLKNEGIRKRDALSDMQKRIEEMTGFPEELARIRENLSKLDDPRGRCRNLRLSLEREPEIQSVIEALDTKRKKLSDSLQSLREQLTEFVSLDQQITLERERRAASEKDHRIYIEHHPIASTLDARQAELKTIEEELESYSIRLGELKHSLDHARSVYDEASHQSVRRLLEEVIDRVATLTSELNASTARLAEVGQEVERLFAAKHRLQTLTDERQKYGSLLDLSDFIRDVLKKAVPFITEAHLQSISIEANQLYREITGNPMASLSWDSGYEIILEEDGHERPFANMSGGEQMAAALAVRLALLKELSDIRLAFFDEPTTNMDEERRRNLAQQIGRIKDFDQLFVISHDDTFEGFTDRVVHIHPPAERTAG